MYYEEAWIDNAWHFRTTPEGMWHPMESLKAAAKTAMLQQTNADLLQALKAMTRTFLDGSHYETTNPYCRPVVKEALKAIARAEGKSTFGNDWMDALSLVSEEAK